MSNHDQPEQGSARKRRGRGCLVSLGGMVAVLLGLMLLGACYESVAEARDVRAYPLPARWSTSVGIVSTSTVLARAAQLW